MSIFEVSDGTGFRMNYDVREGMVPQDVFFIHGNVASNRWWAPAEEVWRRQAQGRKYQGRLIYGEFRGCGLSSPPGSPHEIDMHRFALDFIELIQSLRQGPMHLVGHSTGGLIAALMLFLAPELFERAVLLDPVSPAGIEFSPILIRSFQKMKADMEFTAQVVAPAIHGLDKNAEFFRNVIVPDAFSAVQSLEHFVLKALAEIDVRKEVAKIQHPVLILHGQHDQVLPLEDSKAFAELLPKGEFKILSSRGHSANVEDPELFVQEVRDFLFSDDSKSKT